MMGREPTDAPSAVGQPLFATTHWSVVLAAANHETPEAAAALERLCGTYWYPLYVYVRRRGYGPEDAQDLTQQFFALLLQKDYFRLADPARGRFRTFLLHALEHFVINEWKRAHRLKRGGGAVCLPLDLPAGEQRYALESANSTTPEQAYEKRWALTLLDQVLASLRQQYTAAKKERLFDELARLLWGKDSNSRSDSYVAVGARLGMSENAVRVAMHRLRERYRQLLKAEVAQTVASPGEVDEEVRYLLRVVSGTV
ncbi:MAG TPA: sigma-70 family RNA polymerase sigma factor [Verrucomicrobiae bacterium]